MLMGDATKEGSVICGCFGLLYAYALGGSGGANIGAEERWTCMAAA